MNTNSTLGIYIHIPFCRSKCLYCDFYSIPAAKEEAIERYVDALCRHIEYMGGQADGRTVDSVFIGGGTPTVMNVGQFGRVCSSLEKGFSLSFDCEFTVEANPATFDVDKVAAYDEEKKAALAANAGIIRNRLKIKAAVRNAQIFKEIVAEYGSFEAYLRRFWSGHTIYENTETRSPLSDAISKDLTARGMKFVGSTIIYAYLQAIGVINSHDSGCFLYRTNK